jgi:hypothetical protein
MGEHCIRRSLLHNQYSSNDQVKKDEMGRACITHGDKKNAYGMLVGKLEGKRPLGRTITRRRREDRIIIDLR